MLKTFLICFSMLVASSAIAGQKAFIVAPKGTTYIRQNQFGGYDYYNRRGKIGWNQRQNYYDRKGMYMRQITPNRLHNTRR